MAGKGPGAKGEIGRVSIRVLPDTSKFREDLKRQLEEATSGVEAKVDVNPDTTGFRKKLEAQVKTAAEGVEAKVKVDADANAVKQAIEKATDGTTKKIPLDFDTSSLRLEWSRFDRILAGSYTTLTRIGSTIKTISTGTRDIARQSVQLRDNFRSASDAAQRMAIRLQTLTFRDVGNNIARATSSARNFFSNFRQGSMNLIRSGLNGISGTFRNIGDNTNHASRGFGAFITRFGAIAGVITQVIGPLLLMEPIAFALVLAGAAITAVWGAAATAIAAVPAALAFVAAPIAAIMLGLDGIKAAAKTLDPVIKKLKDSLSSTFQTGLTPAFETLKSLFPTIQSGLNFIARAISDAGVSLATFLTQEPQVTNLGRTFFNVGLAIKEITPALNDIIGTTLKLTSQKGGFDALTSAVRTFGAEFKKSVENLTNNGTMARAFEGLKGLLNELTRAFVGLVNNGIRVFSTAAPGVNHLLASITGFFERFNWEALGKSVGNVFDGLAKAIDKVPQSTIDNITAAFERIGEMFQDPAFQDQITSMINKLPTLLDILGGMAGDFIDIAEGILAVVDAIVKADTAMNDMFGITDESVKAGTGQIEQSVITGFDNIGQAIRTGTNNSFGLVGPEAQKNLALVPPLVTGELKKTGPAVQEGLAGLPIFAGAEFAKLQPVAQQGMGSMVGVIQSAGPGLNGAITSATSGMPGTVSSTFGSMVGATNTGTGQMTGAMRTGMDGFTQAGAEGTQRAGTAINQGIDRAQSDARGKQSGWRSLGSYLVQGLESGILGMVGRIVAAAIRVVTAAYNAARSYLNVNSPSRRFMPLGSATTEGLAVGMTKATPILTKAARATVQSVFDTSDNLLDAFDGKKLGDSWTTSIENRIPGAIKGAERLMNGSLSGEISSTVSSDGFGGIADKVAEALSGWDVQIDGNGMAKLVNKSNTRKKRR